MSVTAVSPPVAIAIQVDSFDTDIQDGIVLPATDQQARWNGSRNPCSCGTRGGILPCLLAFSCPLLVHAQVMERLGMNLGGSLPAAPSNKKRPIGIFMTYTLVLGLLSLGLRVSMSYKNEGGFLFFGLLWIAATFLIFVALVRARNSFRKAYNLPPVCCDTGGSGCMDDCCVTYFCSPCSALQMANHSHNPDIHAYEPCTRTGLVRKDWQIVEVRSEDIV